MYSLFQVTHLNKLYNERDNFWEYDKDHYSMCLISLIQNTDTQIEDISFNDIKYHYYNNIIGNIGLADPD